MRPGKSAANLTEQAPIEMLLLVRQRSHSEPLFLDDREVPSPIVPAFQDTDGRLGYMGGRGRLDTK